MLTLRPSNEFFIIRFGEMYHCITVSAMDALQWMGAVRMRVQTADKNIIIIHTTPVHQLTSGEDKSWNKSSIKMFLIHNDASSSEKCSGLNQERNLHQIKHRLQVKTALNKCVAWFWCERQQEMHFFTGGRVIMDYGFVFELKRLNAGFVSAFVFSRC